MIRCLSIALMCSCASPREGTAVGNPTTGVTARLGLDDDVVLTRSELAVGSLALVDCSGEAAELPTEGTITFPMARVEVPAGSWCGLELIPDGPLRLDGSVAGESFEALLELNPLVLVAKVPFSGTDMSLRVGPEGWLAAATLELSRGGQILPGGDRHDSLVRAAGEGSRLFSDDNGDGERADQDKVLARPTEAGDSAADTDIQADTDGDDTDRGDDTDAEDDTEVPDDTADDDTDVEDDTGDTEVEDDTDVPGDTATADDTGVEDDTADTADSGADSEVEQDSGDPNETSETGETQDTEFEAEDTEFEAEDTEAEDTDL